VVAVSEEASRAPVGIDVTVAHPARMYDFYLGGKDNFAVDREAASKIINLFPDTPQVARQKRDFMRRSIAMMAQDGIRQFIELGSGLPTQDNAHEIVQRIAGDARVVYVDNDPIVIAHGRALLDTGDHTRVITADLRDPDTLLDDPGLRQMIDFSQPVGLLLIAVLHFVADDPQGLGSVGDLLARYRARLVPGSYLAITHVTGEGATPDRMGEASTVYRTSTAALTTRSEQEITALFAGLDLVEPGVVPTRLWRPGLKPALETTPVILGGVGRLP
jgi:hypothetical protein